MSHIMPGTPGDTNPAKPVVSNVPEFVGAINELKALARPNGAGRTLDLVGAIIKYAEDQVREKVRDEVLTEVADLLMQADETAAALLVDRLREAGESRG